MSAFTNSMFESIKSALTKETTASRTKDFLRTEAGNTYTVRLLPNVKDPTKTFFHYYSYGWNSYSTGQLVMFVSPTTWGQRDPIGEERYRILRNGTEDEKKKMAVILRRENWLVNAYVVKDPVNPDNNGKIKVIRFGKQLHKIIMDAIEGEAAEDFGPRIFDLSSKGCNLKIKVEKQGEYPTYVSSRFESAKEIEGLDSDEYDKTYKGVYDLESYVSVKGYDELKSLFNQHYHCREDVAEEAEITVPQIVTEVKPIKKPASVEPKATKKVEDDLSDDSINNLLKELDE